VALTSNPDRTGRRLWGSFLKMF